MITLPNILGQPPGSKENNEMIYNALPVMEITPSIPQFTAAATLFKLKPDFDSYGTYLNECGFSLAERPLKVAFLADNFPTDTFTNQYSESFLNRFTDLVSTGSAEIAQLTGQRSAGDAVKSILNSMEKSDNGVISAFGAGTSGVLSGIQKGFESVTSGMGTAGKKIQNFANLTGKLLGGARIDMPMIWKNSGFAPSYTITVRLYNPIPANSEYKEKFIIGPLAAILLLALPQTDDGTYYNWPFFHKIEVPGLLYVPAAFIGSITVVKGGDQLQVSYSQELGTIDVRIEFGSLYDTMVVGHKSKYTSEQRPTLENYLENLRKRRGIYIPDTTGKGTDINFQDEKELSTNKNLRVSQGTIDTTSEPGNRVLTSDSNSANLLLNEQPTIA